MTTDGMTVGERSLVGDERTTTDGTMTGEHTTTDGMTVGEHSRAGDERMTTVWAAVWALACNLTQGEEDTYYSLLHPFLHPFVLHLPRGSRLVCYA